MGEPITPTDELLTFFKALADANRLKIVGLLAGQELTVEQLAEMLALRPSTVSHHLSRLSKAGLVSARSESYYNIYRLETSAMEKMAQRLLAQDALPAAAAGVDLDAYDRKVLRTYSNPDGTFKKIPMQQKKQLVLLRHVLQDFEPGRRYSEAQVSEMLEKYNEDYAYLRRQLVEHGFMAREGGGGDYWLVE